MELRIAEIMRILPHRYPFLMVDRVVEVERGRRIVALKNVTINEPYFVGHFPAAPVMPGVLTIECMAQVGAILGLLEESDIETPWSTSWASTAPSFAALLFQETSCAFRARSFGENSDLEDARAGSCRG